MNQIISPAHKHRTWSSCSGRSVVELLIIVAITAILVAIAFPQGIATRRLLRSTGLMREITTQLRFARQQAMSQRQAITFQYDNTNKRMVIIDHGSNPDGTPKNPFNPPQGYVPVPVAGAPILQDPNYPNNGRVVSAIPLAGGGTVAGEISYGVPPGVVFNALGDNTVVTQLNANNQVNLTFQPDGSIVDRNGNPVNNALFIYNLNAPRNTASAISILGTAGRIKLWRYDINANRYVE